MNFLQAAIFGFLIAAVMLFGDCRNRSIMESGADNSTANSTPKPEDAEKKVDDVAERLKAVKNANFAYVFVFRRKDGAEFTSEDKQFLKATAQPEPNRRNLSGDGKAVIVGTNYPFEEKALQNLRNRFNVEDYSDK